MTFISKSASSDSDAEVFYNFISLKERTEGWKGSRFGPVINRQCQSLPLQIHSDTGTKATYFAGKIPILIMTKAGSNLEVLFFFHPASLRDNWHNTV